MTLHDKTIADALAPLNKARAMPPEVYTSPQAFADERERILLRHWFFLCREEQLPRAGDYRAFDTPGGPVLLVRGEDMRLRCFANYCRHRGSILLEGEGNCGRRIICPYHAWSYFSDGRLFGCPDMADAEGFDRTENGLVPLSMDTWAGFVFASPFALFGAAVGGGLGLAIGLPFAPIGLAAGPIGAAYGAALMAAPLSAINSPRRLTSDSALGSVRAPAT